jgi:predicted MFS family arabinose efflux permease
MPAFAISGKRLVAIVCIAQVLVQIGAFFWPALLPQLVLLWNLSNTEAGWITASFYGAYMLSVPVLVTLTDRLDPKRIYLFGVACTIAGHALFGLYADGFWSALWLRALSGLGWAGTYMTGVKLLADRVDAKLMSRAVTGHAASIGISGAVSFSCAGLLAQRYGWQAAFLVVAACAGAAWLLIALWVPGHKAPALKSSDGGALFDFRPVLKNRSAMAYSIAYCVHTLEMNGLRGWGVAFLGYVALSTGADSGVLAPAFVMTALGLIGTVSSVVGNEAAIRFGRRKLVVFAMAGSIVVACMVGLLGSLSVLVGCAAAYGIWTRNLARFVVAYGRGGRHRGALKTRRTTGGSLLARLCGRFRRAADDRRYARSRRRHVAHRVERRIRSDCRPNAGGADRLLAYPSARTCRRSRSGIAAPR